MDDTELVARWREITADLSKKHMEIGSLEAVLIDAKVTRWRQNQEEGVSSVAEGDRLVFLDSSDILKELVVSKAEREAMLEEKDYLGKLL